MEILVMIQIDFVKEEYESLKIPDFVHSRMPEQLRGLINEINHYDVKGFIVAPSQPSNDLADILYVDSLCNPAPPLQGVSRDGQPLYAWFGVIAQTIFFYFKASLVYETISNEMVVSLTKQAANDNDEQRIYPNGH
jgi:hypothetical protein